MDEQQLSDRLSEVIPGGAHTYSRGRDQFPANAPAALARGDGAYVWDQRGNRFLDYGMGLRSVSLGYSRGEVTERVRSILDSGINLTLPTMLELEAAEYLVDLIPSVAMVKFAKHGSNVTTAAIKLARASTGKNLVLVSRQHPFHSFDDWFIGATVMNRGIPSRVRHLTLQFDYNDIESLEQQLVQHQGDVAAVILEPSTHISPCPKQCFPWGDTGPDCGACLMHAENFLMQVRRLCDQHKAVMILDEIITGFRWHVKGAQHQFQVTPDLTTFGKAMANGFALAALGGKAELMSLGGIDEPGAERTFLLSTTHGPEMVGLAAFLGSMDVYESVDVCSHIWKFGAALRAEFEALTERYELTDYLTLEGPSASMVLVARDAEGCPSSALRTLVSQEMIEERVLMPWVSPSLAHGEEELRLTKIAFDRACRTYQKALGGRVEDYLHGRPIMPVFRRRN